jgi:hypothetical protein
MTIRKLTDDQTRAARAAFRETVREAIGQETDPATRKWALLFLKRKAPPKRRGRPLK